MGNVGFFIRSAVVLVILSAFPVVSSASPLYDVQALRGFTPNDFVSPASINDHGAIAGLSRSDTTLSTGVLWDGSAISLGIPPDVLFSVASGINNRRTVVGSVKYPISDGRGDRPFVWNGVFTDLNDLLAPGSMWRVLKLAEDINNREHIVGGGTRAPLSPKPPTTPDSARGFIFRNGVATKLEPLPNFEASIAFAINDLDQVVGSSLSPREKLPIATFWINGGTPLSLGTFGGLRSEALGINNFGQVVGIAHDVAEVSRAFIWQNGLMTALPLPIGARSSRAHSINDAGQVVGLITLADGSTIPALWQDGAIYNLNDLITDHSFRLVSPRSINNAGEIVGVAVLNGTTSAGFLLTPKKPFDMEIVDPNPDLLSNSQLVSDLEQLATQGRRVDGAATDGVTRLLLRFRQLPGLGEVSVSLHDEHDLQSTGIGKLNSVGGAENSNSLTVPVVVLGSGEHVAFAAMSVPEHFVRSFADNDSAVRPVKIRASFISSDLSDNRSAVKALTLYRPPVMLIHGLWSSNDTWSWAVQNDSRFIVHPQGYSSTNASSFSVNISNARAGVARAISRMRDQGIAATQADVFAHSMGGLLTRLYVADPAYRRNENFGEGDVNSLISVDTPHQGSPWANAFISLAQTPGVGLIFADIMRQIGNCVDCGAVSDLQTNSQAISTLPAVSLPVHAMVGVGGSDLIQAGLESSMPTLLRNIWEVAQFFGLAPQDVFPPQTQHDLIVGRISQEGGLSTGGTQTSVFGFRPGVSLGLHTTVTNETVTSNRATDLLNTPVSDGVTYANGFPAASGAAITLNAIGATQPTPALRTAQLAPAVGPVTTGIEITQPTTNALLTAGQPVTVTVEPRDGFVPVRVLIVTDFLAQRVEGAPFSLTFDVPHELTGSFTISAYAFDAADNLAVAPKIAVDVAVPAILTGILARPEKLYLFSYDLEEQLQVLGIYDDDVQRDLGSSAVGTAYISQDPSVATVDSAGIVTGVQPGKTVITITNGQHRSDVEVEVVSVAQPDTAPPVTTASTSPVANVSGWNNTDVTVSFNSIDNETGGTGVKEIRVSLSGAQVGTTVIPGGSGSVTVSVEGSTSIVYFAVDNAGNSEAAQVLTLKIDKTLPVITGLPAPGCTLWPPNHKLVQVATVSANDNFSGLATFDVNASSSEPPGGKEPDVIITETGSQAWAIQLRAERLGTGTGRVYTISANARDLADNATSAVATCIVPHDRRH